MLGRRFVSRKEVTSPPSVRIPSQCSKQRSIPERTHLQVNLIIIKHVLYEARLGQRVSAYVLYFPKLRPKNQNIMAELLSEGAHSPRGGGGMIITSPFKEIDASSLLGSFGGSRLLDMNLRPESMNKKLCWVHCTLTHRSRYNPQRFEKRLRQEGARPKG